MLFCGPCCYLPFSPFQGNQTSWWPVQNLSMVVSSFVGHMYLCVKVVRLYNFAGVKPYSLVVGYCEFRFWLFQIQVLTWGVNELRNWCAICLVSEPTRSSRGNTTGFGAYSSTGTRWKGQTMHRGSKLFPILSAPVVNSLYKQFIKYMWWSRLGYDFLWYPRILPRMFTVKHFVPNPIKDKFFNTISCSVYRCTKI